MKSSEIFLARFAVLFSFFEPRGKIVWESHVFDLRNCQKSTGTQFDPKRMKLSFFGGNILWGSRSPRDTPRKIKFTLDSNFDSISVCVARWKEAAKRPPRHDGRLRRHSGQEGPAAVPEREDYRVPPRSAVLLSQKLTR